MKDTSKKQIIKVFLISILGLVIILGMLYFNHKTNIQQNKAQATKKRVLQYESTLKKELEKYNLGEKTPILLGIMYQESRGEGNDPMQSSESRGLKPNEIQETSLSIEQGVNTLLKCTNMERTRMLAWIQLFKAIIWGQVILILLLVKKLNNTRRIQPKSFLR